MVSMLQRKTGASMRRIGILVVFAAVAGPLPVLPPALAETVVQRMTAEFSYALRNRLEDRDGFWFVTYELRGHAFPNDRADHSLALSCIGSAWGFDHRHGGEEALCRLSGGTDLLFARLRRAEGDAEQAGLTFELYGGRGVYGGYVGWASGLREMDLSGERPTGRGSMALRLALQPAPNGAE